MLVFDQNQLEAAHEIVGEVVAPTPQYAWPLLRERLGIEVWVKHENHSPTGAFKVRGGLVYLNELVKSDVRVRGLVTATRGNHGQSIPFAALRYGIPTTIVVPVGNAVEKNAAMKAFGARLVVYGSDFDEAREEAERLAETDGLTMVPSFHPLLVRGVATYARELLNGVKDLDAVYVPIGMGSGICGLITVRDLLGLKTQIIGVVSTNAPAYALSYEAGTVVTTNEARTFADGMACRVPSPDALEVIRAGAARITQVSDEEVAEAMRVYHTDTHNLAEGAGAAALAALMQERIEMAGKRAGVILCGGNVDTAVYAEVLAGRTPVA